MSDFNGIVLADPLLSGCIEVILTGIRMIADFGVAPLEAVEAVNAMPLGLVANRGAHVDETSRSRH